MKPYRWVPFLALASLASPVLASEPTPEYVQASPAFYSFGPVMAGQTRFMNVWFQNFSPEPIPYFNATCGGDFSAFDCSSSCFMLPAYGSCAVTVTFHPRNGDGLLRTIQVQGYGRGGFATSTIQGIDQKQ